MGRAIQLTIPKACQEDWHTMTVEQQGRYCMSCCKTVVDFTNMSDRDILHHIANAGGSRVCARLHPDQLHRSMTIHRESRWPWLKYFFQFTLPAFLISMKVGGQEPVRKSTDAVFITNKLLESVHADSGKSAIKGRVLDEWGEPVAGASVVIKGSNTGTSTDVEGYFSIDRANDQEVVLWVSAVGFMHQEIKVNTKDRSEVKLLQLSMSYMVLGEVSIVRPKKNKRSALEVARSVIISDSVKLSPNPVGVGNDISVEFTVKQTGKFDVELCDFSGRTISKKRVLAESKYFKTTIGTQSLLPGSYIVSIRNHKGKKIGVKKVIIQN